MLLWRKPRQVYFNPHSHEGSDPTRIPMCLRMRNFNPHSHEGSDLFPVTVVSVVSSISIHTPTRGVTRAGIFKSFSHSDFNPHSHEGSDKEIMRLQILFDDFNPHSHEGSDSPHKQAVLICADFNPHSHEGSDPFFYSYTLSRCNFNPHSHEGSDTIPKDLKAKLEISIHTPTRGVTIVRSS